MGNSGMSGSAGGGAPRRATLRPRRLVSTCQPQPRPWEAFLQHEARAVPVFHGERALSTSGWDPGLERNLLPAPRVIIEDALAGGSTTWGRKWSILGPSWSQDFCARGERLELHLASVQLWVWLGVLQAAGHGQGCPHGAPRASRGPGPACDAHPAHACGHESEPGRKRPHPAQAERCRAPGLGADRGDSSSLLVAPAPAAWRKGFGANRVPHHLVRVSMQMLQDGVLETF